MSDTHMALGQSPHDHAGCVRRALAAAEALARKRKLRFTPLRRRVLEIVLASHRPIGAYDVLHVLGETQAQRKPAPPTVYRALDFLLREGFVHRIDTMNAYVACFSPEHRRHTYFLLCKRCGCAAEIEHGALDHALEEIAVDAGFTVERETVEIVGLCAVCAEIVPAMPSLR